MVCGTSEPAKSSSPLRADNWPAPVPVGEYEADTCIKVSAITDASKLR